ncbi:MAG: hypothetical protein LQ346_000457 [Caloplaca aetnensis]|nr:MAG: hypothetical protein LQ346_000457 [Caloplaca aetnensis]
MVYWVVLSSFVLLALATAPNNANNDLGQTLRKGGKIANLAENYGAVKSLCIDKCRRLKGPVYVFFNVHADFHKPMTSPYVRAYCSATDISNNPSKLFELDQDRCIKTFTRLLDESACTGNKPECKDGQNFGGRLVDGEVAFRVYGELMPK